MHTLFFYGTLCHPPLLRAVLGREVTAVPARLGDHAVHWVSGRNFPMILPRAGAVAEGVVVEGLGDGDVARLDFYEGGFAYATRAVTVRHGAGTVTARVYFPEPDAGWTPGAPWSLSGWAARWGEVVVLAAHEVMDRFGQVPAATVHARYSSILTRAGARLRAATAPAPATLRRHCAPGDLRVEAQDQPYARFFAVEDYALRYRRFDGTMGDPIGRTAFVSADAATVLPYDPLRDKVMVVEQFRAGPFARGDAEPWHLEPIAGRVDAGETPEEAALREAVEEANLTLRALLPIASYYPSPGAKTEFLYSYLGLADLPDGAAGLGGLDAESEDIRAHLLSFDALMALVASGEAATGPLLLSALWLQRERPRLRAEAGG